jgi:6-phosphogluconate dehydrogenase
MRFGIVGLGRMGSNLALHAAEKGHDVIVFDRGKDARERTAAAGLVTTSSLEELVSALAPPRIVFIYVPHGDATEQVVQALQPLLASGDIVIDGGNSHWMDGRRRHEFFARGGVHFLDVGTSGGVTGARHGACFMAGGNRDAFDAIAPILRDLAVDDGGVLYVGEPGAGHFVKLIHNAIEFGMVQSIAEGVELLKRSDYELDLSALLDNWQHGSVVRSWLVELMANALRTETDFRELSTYVEDTGEVKWVINWAFDRDIPTPAITASQTELMRDRDADTVTAKAVALLRNQYGGHPVHHVGEDSASAQH